MIFLALFTIITTGGWLGYIVWASFFNEASWVISPRNLESLFKFLMTITPAFILSLWNAYYLLFGRLRENFKIERQNERLRKKIEQEELELKLQDLRKENKKDQSNEE
jgi:cell shape-determining protein MreC